MKEYSADDKLGYSRATQRLMHWLFADIANHNTGAKAGTTPNDLHAHQAKEQMKKEYIKLIGHEGKKQPLLTYMEDLKAFHQECIENGATVEELAELSEQYNSTVLVKEFQLFQMYYGSFSVSLQMMNQASANRFVRFLFDYMIENDIVMRDKISKLYAEQQDQNRIFTLLKYKKCCICNKEVKFPHHSRRVGGTQYKNDKGDLAISPLCSYHHSEIHQGYSENDFKKKYQTYGWIKLTDRQIGLMQDIYPNYAEGYKKELEYEKE